MPHLPVTVRKVSTPDRQSLANLIHFQTHVHQHLDWRSPLDWIGAQPYLVGEIDGSVRSAIVCPPDPPNVAWIRLFAVDDSVNPTQAWQTLWPVAQAALMEMCLSEIAAIPVEPWFRQLLETAHFFHSQNIVSLYWDGSLPLPPARFVNIRNMQDDNLVAVDALDAVAFAPLWRNTGGMLAIAYHQAMLATVAEVDDQIVGYQISTVGPQGGHLARLAVHPNWQGRGIGYALVCGLLNQFTLRGVHCISVNTQEENLASLKLYQKAGFKRAGEVFPVYRQSQS